MANRSGAGYSPARTIILMLMAVLTLGVTVLAVACFGNKDVNDPKTPSNIAGESIPEKTKEDQSGPAVKPSEENPTEEPSVERTQVPTEQPTEKTTEKSSEHSADHPEEQPTEKPTEQPTEKPTEKQNSEPAVPAYLSVEVKGSYYVGQTLTQSDFDVHMVMSDQSTREVASYHAASSLYLSKPENVVRIEAEGFVGEVVVPALDYGTFSAYYPDAAASALIGGYRCGTTPVTPGTPCLDHFDGKFAVRDAITYLGHPYYDTDGIHSFYECNQLVGSSLFDLGLSKIGTLKFKSNAPGDIYIPNSVAWEKLMTDLTGVETSALRDGAYANTTAVFGNELKSVDIFYFHNLTNHQQDLKVGDIIYFPRSVSIAHNNGYSGHLMFVLGDFSSITPEMALQEYTFANPGCTPDVSVAMSYAVRNRIAADPDYGPNAAYSPRGRLDYYNPEKAKATDGISYGTVVGTVRNYWDDPQGHYMWFIESSRKYGGVTISNRTFASDPARVEAYVIRISR
ncbi:MAG: PT domain-containing protein [Lachnospiraceae bacterium]|nr:PT domain-containing protein [Lachnospiraceae bacterium]